MYIHQLPEGTCLQNGKYHIHSYLGQGSMGIIYLASCIKNSSDGPVSGICAIKEFFPYTLAERSGKTVTYAEDNWVSKLKTFFPEEYHTLSCLSHPNIIRVHDLFIENNTLYYVMDYINGDTLYDYIRKNGPLSGEKAARLFSQLGNIVNFLHENNTAHLDLKPNNIKMLPNGEPVLLDFFLSRRFSGPGCIMKGEWVPMGTKGFTPEEQFSDTWNGHHVTASDVYGLAATFYYVLTGCIPPAAYEIEYDGFPVQALEQVGLSYESIRLMKKAMAYRCHDRIQFVSLFVEPFLASLQDTADMPVLAGTSTTTDQKGSDTIHGFQIRWHNDTTRNEKQFICDILKHMSPIGQVLPIKSLNPQAKEPLMPLMPPVPLYILPDNTDYPAAEPLPLHQILQTLNLLVQRTGLSFRLASRKELRSLVTENIEEKNVFVCYNEEKGLEFGVLDPSAEWSTDPSAFGRRLHFQLVCEGNSPSFNNGMFESPFSDYYYDEIVGLGFNFFKISRNGTWSIFYTKEHTNAIKGETYDSISDIHLLSIPGPGIPRLFVGLHASKGESTTFYEFAGRTLIKLGTYTKEELELRSMFS